jgi:hypothetical protein
MAPFLSLIVFNMGLLRFGLVSPFTASPMLVFRTSPEHLAIAYLLLTQGRQALHIRHICPPKIN